MLKLVGAHDDKLLYGTGDLYVTVFGGRTRMIGTLLGRGMKYTQAREELKGVTLESVAITKVVVEALKKRCIGMDRFPLLNHIYSMIKEDITVNIPWTSFEEDEKIAL